MGTETDTNNNPEGLDLSGGNGGSDSDHLQRLAEEEASRQGWVPQDKYKKDPSTWVDASTFLSRGKQHNSALKRQVEELTAQVRSFEGTREKFVKYYEEQLTQKQSELDAAIRSLRIQRSEASAEGDHESAVTLEDRIEALQKQRQELREEAAGAKERADGSPAAKAKDDPDAAGTTNKDLEEWIESDNQWFKTDAKLRNYAVALGEELISQGETLRGRAFLDKVANLMRDEFPARFNNPRRDRAGTAESGRSSVTVNGKGERDLPEADRKLMEEFVASGWLTKEKFLKDYWTRNG